MLVGWAQAEHGVPPVKCMAQYERLKAFSRERPAYPTGLDQAGQEAFLKEWKADREQRRQVEIERYRAMSSPLIRGVILFASLVGTVSIAMVGTPRNAQYAGTVRLDGTESVWRQNPWKESFDSIAVPNGILSYNDQAVASLIVNTENGQAPWDNSIGEDAIVMQAAAIKWAAGGSISYANKARELLMAWVTTLNSITGDERDHRVAWTTPKLIHTAEILRDLPGSPWTGSDETAFRNWVAARLLPILPTTSASNPGGNEPCHLPSGDTSDVGRLYRESDAL